MTDSPRWSGAGTLCPFCEQEGRDIGAVRVCANPQCWNYECGVDGVTYSSRIVIALRARIEALEAERDALERWVTKAKLAARDVRDLMYQEPPTSASLLDAMFSRLLQIVENEVPGAIDAAVDS